MNTDAICAKGDATYKDGVWVCAGCQRTFKRSPNQHIYAARRRLRVANPPTCGDPDCPIERDKDRAVAAKLKRAAP